MAGKYKYCFDCRNCQNTQTILTAPGKWETYCIPTRDHESTVEIEDYNLICRKYIPRQIEMEEFQNEV